MAQNTMTDNAAATDQASIPSGPAAAGHDVNEVHVVAKVTTAPERRRLPSGDEVVAFGISVRRPGGGVDAVPVQVGPAPPSGRRPSAGQVGRRILADAQRFQVGQRVEIRGRLQRRWWAAGGGRRSRVEVVACSVRSPTGQTSGSSSSSSSVGSSSDGRRSPGRAR